MVFVAVAVQWYCTLGRLANPKDGLMARNILQAAGCSLENRYIDHATTPSHDR